MDRTERGIHRGGLGMNLRAGLVLESVGDELLVLDTETGAIHRLLPEAAQYLRMVERGEIATDIRASQTLHDLIDAGLIEVPPTSEGPHGLTRRQMLGVAAATVGAVSVITAALPSAAAAATVVPVPMQLQSPVYWGDNGDNSTYIYVRWQ